MLPDKDSIERRPGVVLVFCEDGVGGRGAKVSNYALYTAVPDSVPGFKVFWKLDVQPLGEADLVGLRPPPLVVMYQ
jgi:hypothetical protein